MPDEAADLVPEPVLETFGLGGAAVARVESGLINAHWLVLPMADAGERVVVCRYNPSRSAAAVAWEQRLVELAAAKGWPVAAPIAATDGGTLVEHEGRLWAAAPFVQGDPEPEPSPARYHIRGRLLARLHHDLAAFELADQRPDFGKTWELDAWLAPSNAGSFNELLAAFAREHADLASLIRRQRYRNLRELARLHYPDLPNLPIHGDFQGSNLLWQEGRLSGLIDFDFTRRDAQICDLATILTPFQPLALQFAGPMLEGYESGRPLSDVEWALLPALARADLLWWTTLLLAGWRTGTNPRALAGIQRTMTERLPALDAWEPKFRVLRGTLSR